jgi:hypothetical protein
MESILKDTLCFLDAIPQIDYEDLVRRLYTPDLVVQLCTAFLYKLFSAIFHSNEMALVDGATRKGYQT